MKWKLQRKHIALYNKITVFNEAWHFSKKESRKKI